MKAKSDVIIVGGGQAGLAASHHLTLNGIEHAVLEAGDGPGTFWGGLWDSFTLVTTNFMLNLPGAEYSGPEPEGHLNRAETIAYLARFAEGKPVQYGTRVTGISQTPDGFRIQTSQGSSDARQVIVASGAYHHPKLPAFAVALPKGILQITTHEYKNPAALPDGAVLVVGSGQSGCQIAEELYQAGRKVYLAVGRAGRVPRYYRGRDITWWLDKTGFFELSVDKLPSPQARFAANPMLSGKDGGHELNLHQFARDGVTLLGHIRSVDGSRMSLAPDLHENLQWTDNFEKEKLQGIDRWIESSGEEKPPLEERPDRREAYAAPTLESLDLDAAGIKTVIFACGYSNEYGWIQAPIFDTNGWPVHTRGITSVPGLYFLGLPFLHKRKSSILYGVAEDAQYIGQAAAAYAANPSQPLPQASQAVRQAGSAA